MAKYDLNLNLLFAALSDETRRDIVARLSRGPASVSELHAHHDMALPSFMTHLAKLENAGLIETVKKGRVRNCRLTPNGMRPAQHWLEQQNEMWEKRLDQFDAYALEIAKRKNK
jgi:DNA-binding transcriptional ArsR family regulator